MWKQRLKEAISMEFSIVLFGDEGIGKKTIVFEYLKRENIVYNHLDYASGFSQIQENDKENYIVATNFSVDLIEEMLPKWRCDLKHKYIIISNSSPEKLKSELFDFDAVQILCEPPTQDEIKKFMISKNCAERRAAKLVQFIEMHTHKWKDAEYLALVLCNVEDQHFESYTKFVINNLGICKYQNEKTLMDDYNSIVIQNTKPYRPEENNQIRLEGLGSLEKLIIVSATISSYSLQSNDLKNFGKYEVSKSRSVVSALCRRFPADRLYSICEYFINNGSIELSNDFIFNPLCFYTLICDLCEKGYIKIYPLKNKMCDLCQIYMKSNVSQEQADNLADILNIKLKDYIKPG